MADLDAAVHHLARALDALEDKLGERLRDLADKDDAVAAARRQARIAHAEANRAGAELSCAIAGLKALLGAPPTGAAPPADAPEPVIEQSPLEQEPHGASRHSG